MLRTSTLLFAVGILGACSSATAPSSADENEALATASADPGTASSSEPDGTDLVTTEDAMWAERAADEPADTPAPAVLLAAGDIAYCDGRFADAVRVAELLEQTPGTVAPLGDLAYPDGTTQQFAECFDPSWGRVRDRMRPTVGNHDLGTPGAGPYFDYFGDVAGERGKGWYSYELGAWHVVVLNANCWAVGGCGAGSEQHHWLLDDLAAAEANNIVGYWHSPRWSSGRHGDHAEVAPFVQAIYDAGGDLILQAHDHHYERFAPMRPDGTVADDGVRSFVVGTGGGEIRPIPTVRSGSEFRQNTEHGVLQLTLDECSYDWAFLSVDSAEPLDSGTHANTC